MPKNRLLRYLPTRSEIRESKALRPVAHLLKDNDLWHFNRRSVSGSVFIGLFVAFLPVPMQMVIAALIAIGMRTNLPIAVAMVWITNPLTIPPMFYFSYRLGAWLLDMQTTVDAFEFSFEWLLDNLATIGYPLIFGSLVCGWVVGISGFVITRVLWRLHIIRRLKARREKRRRVRALKRARRAAAQGEAESDPPNRDLS
ncbi:MAG: DUF2062 domain-containing protein [Pseudomonadota bacterium]